MISLRGILEVESLGSRVRTFWGACSCINSFLEKQLILRLYENASFILFLSILENIFFKNAIFIGGEGILF